MFYANFLGDNPPSFPFLALIISGGHSQIVLFRNHGDYELIGQTADDALARPLIRWLRLLAYPTLADPPLPRQPRLVIHIVFTFLRRICRTSMIFLSRTKDSGVT